MRTAVALRDWHLRRANPGGLRPLGFRRGRRHAEKAEDAAEKAGHPDATFTSKIDAMRLAERTELRDALTTKEQVRFDKNVAALGTKKP